MPVRVPARKSACEWARKYRASPPANATPASAAMTHAARFAGWADGVRATAICPGAIDTEMIANLPGVTPKAERLQPETVAGLVAFVLDLPNQASVPELVANTRLESTI